MTAFSDANGLFLDDPGYDDRLWLIGFSVKARLLVVVHVEIGDRTRIISARKAERMKRSSTARAEPRREDDDGLQADLSKLRVRGRGLGLNKRMAPRTLREALGISQAELGERLRMDQSQVSKLEAGDDHLVSTLRRYAGALGGELVVMIELDGRRYRIG